MSQREIKFRAWDGGDMHYNVLAGHGDYVANHDDDHIWWWAKPPEAIMQYTGLKDKNGKEIYEGDIYPFRGDDGGEPFNIFVVYLDGAFWGCTEGSLMPDGKWETPYILYEDLHDRVNVTEANPFGDEVVAIEIIGNIYENPKLIDPKE